MDVSFCILHLRKLRKLGKLGKRWLTMEVYVGCNLMGCTFIHLVVPLPTQILPIPSLEQPCLQGSRGCHMEGKKSYFWASSRCLKSYLEKSYFSYQESICSKKSRLPNYVSLLWVYCFSILRRNLLGGGVNGKRHPNEGPKNAKLLGGAILTAQSGGVGWGASQARMWWTCIVILLGLAAGRQVVCPTC